MSFEGNVRMVLFFSRRAFKTVKMNPAIQNQNEIPKFMIRMPEFKAEKVTTGDRMFIVGRDYYANDGTIMRDYDIPDYIVTDRLNNIFLYTIDKGKEYWLVINNLASRIVATYDYTGNKSDGYCVNWNIVKAIAPPQLYYLSVAQYNNIIQKAFEAYSYVVLANDE